MTETGTCSLCGGPYTHWGNNPYPLKDISERCCDKCNHEKVLPARMNLPEGALGDWATAKAQQEEAMRVLQNRQVTDGQSRN